MKKLKTSILALCLLSVFGTSAYAANITFEIAQVEILLSDKGKWESRATTKGSYGTTHARSYTEIWAGGKKQDYKESPKQAGVGPVIASAYAPIGLSDTYSTSGHRIWWGSTDKESISTTDRTSI
ncbi:hypothetical protein AAFJ72_18150 [Brevibacillus gelatini]|uniref:hypothetical protein n=1 Tax=Brevibacillus gelatini TaxID=1655277 RepID=UPI003D81A9F4